MNPFENSVTPSVEDVMTMVTSLSSAQPKEQEAFLKSIHNTPTEEVLKTVVEFINTPNDKKAEFGNPKVEPASTEGKPLSKSFKDALDKLNKK